MLRNSTVKVVPFIISFVGVAVDYLTTVVGLKLGFYETHLNYHPVLALVIFWGALTVLTVSLPRTKVWEIIKNILASASFLGAANNMLVILGIFSGLVI